MNLDHLKWRRQAMKLTDVEVSEFQSIRSSNCFDVGDITCLVGKNESGKTALLQALYRLNPIIPAHGKFDVTDDYPRAEVEDYQQDIEANRRTPAVVIQATFTLSSEEASNVESEFGTGILESPMLTLKKGYANTLFVELPVNEQIAVKNMIDTAQLSPTLSKNLSKCSDVEELGALINEKIANVPDTESPNENEDEDESKMQSLNTLIRAIQETKGLPKYIFNKHLKTELPKFLYYDEYFMMTGQENIEALSERVEQDELKESDYPLLGLIELARLELDELVNPNRTEWFLNKLEGASNHLSKQILQYWSQNKHLLMKFDVRPGRPGDKEGMTSGTNILARIHDSKRMVSTPLGTRSRGFVWFFSFLSWFDQQQRNNESLILLLDEPGLFLHGRAQGDLLRYIDEELKGNHQVIYTTHSPFMVDSTKFDRVRIVQDKSMDSDEPIPSDEDGTKVITEVLEASQDSLFPLQGALGYDIYQTLFVGPNSLVVEGVSDLLYIQTISALLDSQGRKGLSEKWTITPVGGADKVPTFVALLGSQKGLKIATLIDFQKKNQQTIENLYKRKLLRKQNVLTFAEFTGGTEADIEDMFDVDFYLKIVNEEYAKELDKTITKDILTLKAHRIVPRLDDFFTANPQSGVDFNHYRPARYFTENISSLMAEIQQETLDRFEAAFKALNGLL